MRSALKLARWPAVLATVALAVTLSVGAPHPGTAERAYAGFMGLVGLLVAISWVRGAADSVALADDRGGGRGGGPSSHRRSLQGRLGSHGNSVPAHPIVEAAISLERSLRLGAATMGDYRRLVEPRLAAVMRGRLARSGTAGLDPERARALLGESYRLVDPRRPPETDRFARGVPITDVAGFLDALEGKS
jgi:hypothetical protein